MRCWVGLLLVSLISPSVYAQPSGGAEDPDKSARPGMPPVLENDAGFVVQSFRGGPDKDTVAAHCQTLRVEWNARWTGGRSAVKWETPCEVVIHAHRQGYTAAVGRPGGATLGSSLVRRERDGNVTRRIDLLPATNGELSALAHELVHVILADHFPAGPPPLWIDEGLAMLVDSPHKQARHWRDCGAAIRSGTMLPLQRLMELDRPTSPAEFPAVYGQSLTLTRFLVERGDPQKLLAFAQQSQAHGHVAALQAIYGIRGWDEFEREWRAFVRSQSDRS